MYVHRLLKCVMGRVNVGGGVQPWHMVYVRNAGGEGGSETRTTVCPTISSGRASFRGQADEQVGH